MSQFKLLLLVAENDGSRVGDLALALHVTPPTVTASLDRLVGHGLVRREDDPLDRRLVIARLTPEGRELLQRLNLQHREEISECLGELSEAQLDGLYGGLAALQRVWNERHGTQSRD
jgi:DNA-binding MarR family transcriptional regulator